jgi:hypothetical protein
MLRGAFVKAAPKYRINAGARRFEAIPDRNAAKNIAR